MRSAKFSLLVACMVGGAGAQGAVSRLVDGAEGPMTWENGKLGDSAVIKSLTASPAGPMAGTKSILVQLDSLDGTQDTATLGWPRQAGVQTNAIPANCVDMTKAKRISVSVRAVQADPPGFAWLQARIYLKTGPAWLWHTTEGLEGKEGMTNILDTGWITIERDVGDFYAAGDTAAGIQNPEQLRSIGVQFFTYNGPWTGTIQIDEVRLVDELAVSVADRKVSKAGLGRTRLPARFKGARLDGRRLEPAPKGR